MWIIYWHPSLFLRARNVLLNTQKHSIHHWNETRRTVCQKFAVNDMLVQKRTPVRLFQLSLSSLACPSLRVVIPLDANKHTDTLLMKSTILRLSSLVITQQYKTVVEPCSALLTLRYLNCQSYLSRLCIALYLSIRRALSWRTKACLESLCATVNVLVVQSVWSSVWNLWSRLQFQIISCPWWPGQSLDSASLLPNGEMHVSLLDDEPGRTKVWEENDVRMICSFVTIK